MVPQAYLERMDRSCDRQLNLINSLVETQQLEVWGVPLQCRPLHLSQLVSELAAEWEPRLAQHEARLENLITHDIPVIEADYHQLWRVYENLVANALKHNPTGVQLTLSAELHESQGHNSRMAFVRCLVADTGVGLEPEQIETLFQLYQRGSAARKTTGLGLGLYLCRKL
ncbi:MAG: HAMP domain-containing histidine kinase [Chloroflexaceae bacterium]|nr:HAMP domain-containing histidine kinase [Chloroflexaceae bacterium]